MRLPTNFLDMDQDDQDAMDNKDFLTIMALDVCNGFAFQTKSTVWYGMDQEKLELMKAMKQRLEMEIKARSDERLPEGVAMIVLDSPEKVEDLYKFLDKELGH